MYYGNFAQSYSVFISLYSLFFILQISSEYTSKSDDKMKDSQIK